MAFLLSEYPHTLSVSRVSGMKTGSKTRPLDMSRHVAGPQLKH